MIRTAHIAAMAALACWAAAPIALADDDTADAVVEAAESTAGKATQQTEDAAQAAREARAVSPESLAAAKQKAKQRKAIGSRGNSNKFGSLEGLDGDELVCRVETKTGSRLKKQACYRVADIRAYRERLKEIGSLPGQRSAAGLTETPGDGL